MGGETDSGSKDRRGDRIEVDPQEVRRRTAEVLSRLDELELRVEKLIQGGEGLCRPHGVPVFVPGAVPGDLLRVRLLEARPRFGRAEIVEVLEPGPHRVDPPCPVFHRCGGCDLQQIASEEQLGHKVDAALETLRRLGGVEPSSSRVDAVPGPLWGYRSRAQLHTRGQGDALEIGYHERGARELVPTTACPILVPELEAALPGLQEELRRVETPPKRVDLAMAGGRLTAAPAVGDLPRGPVARTVAGFELEYDARSFFQANEPLLETLVEHAVGEHEGELALELMCGVGLFTLPLARRYRRVVAVESDSGAARFARRNAKRNRVGNVEVHGGSGEALAGRWLGDADRVLVDPPRVGLARPLALELAERPVDRLTYVSCDVATLARDLRRLLPSYRIESLVFLDFVPQTGHLETVAQLVRGRESGGS